MERVRPIVERIVKHLLSRLLKHAEKVHYV